MNLKRAMGFADVLGKNTEFAWWDFRVEQMESSPHNKIVGRNRVTGTFPYTPKREYVDVPEPTDDDGSRP